MAWKPPLPPDVPPLAPRGEPARLGDVLSQLFAARGYGRVQGDRQLTEVWREVAGPAISAGTRPLALRNGVLNIAVNSSALLLELSSFHKPRLLSALQEQHPEWKLKDLKFKLRSPRA